MLWPNSSVQDLSFEIGQALEWRDELFGRESDAGNEISTVNLATIRTLDQPLVSFLVKDCCVHVSIVGDVFLQIPLLFDILEVASQLWPTRIALLEREAFPQFLIVELVDGSIAVDSRTGITVPIPDSTGSFEGLLIESNLKS